MIRLGERQRNIIYLPHYVALSGGYYEASGCDVRLWEQDVVDGPDALTEGRIDLLLGGPARTFRYLEDFGTALPSVATIVQRHPWFLLQRGPSSAFAWQDLIGSVVIDFREAGTPRFGLQAALLKADIDPGSMVLDAGFSAADGLEAFITGHGDYLLHSLHTAEEFVLGGDLSVAASLAPTLGDIAFTTLSTSSGWLADHGEACANMLRGLESACMAVHAALDAQDVREIVAMVMPYFPDMETDIIASAIVRYGDYEIWPRQPVVTEESLRRLHQLLSSVGSLSGQSDPRSLLPSLGGSSPPAEAAG